MAEITFDEQWADVVPLPQVDAPDAVVKIAYTKDFTRLMDLFRAVVSKEEYTERVLELTEELLELNAANYTIWLYRRNCLKKMNLDLNEELDYLDGFSRENPKNYQIWHHRRTVVEWLGSGDRELAFCESVFEEDAKNYHAWAHRQWALQTYNLWGQELAFIEECLKNDVRNNSAWNQRWFYVHSGPEMLTQEVLDRELEYTVASLAQVTLNESAWNYLRGLHKTHNAELHEAIKTRVSEIVASSERRNPFALGLLADICESTGTALLSPSPNTDAEAPSAVTASDAARGLQELKEAAKMCVELVSLDQIRAKSWTRRVLALNQRIQSYAV